MRSTLTHMGPLCRELNSVFVVPPSGGIRGKEKRDSGCGVPPPLFSGDLRRDAAATTSKPPA